MSPLALPDVRRGLVAALAVALAACGRRDTARDHARDRARVPDSAAAATAAAGAFRPLAVGDSAPAYAARTLAGDTVRVGPGTGAPPTLVNVWATWCTSCREEMGDLATLQREFAPKGLRVIAVSVDNGAPARVERFVEHEQLPFTVAYDPDAVVQERFRTVGVPESYLIGRDGRVAWRHAGNIHAVMDSARAAAAAVLAAR